MNVLIFNTTKKEIIFYRMKDGEKLYDGEDLDFFKNSNHIHLENIPTVRTEANYYEVMQIVTDQASISSPLRVPVLRIPNANTLMFITK